MPDEQKERVHLTDPTRIRALAHPTRMRILALLRVGGSQTAATLGASVDEAPGTISYHCARLAAAGLIEPAPAQSDDRRERWWRAAHVATDAGLSDALHDPEQYVATAALHRTAADFFTTAYQRYLERAPGFGEKWVAAAGGNDRVLRLTPAELTALMQELEDVVGRFADRGEQHGPDEGAEQVYVLTQGYRWPW